MVIIVKDSLFVSQHMHQVTNLWICWRNWSSKLQEKIEKKTCCTSWCAFRCLVMKGFRPEDLKMSEALSLLLKLLYFGEAVSHTLLHTFKSTPLLEPSRFFRKVTGYNWFKFLGEQKQKILGRGWSKTDDWPRTTLLTIRRTANNRARQLSW